MDGQKSSRTGSINMTAGEKVGSHQSTDMMKNPQTDGERCQSHQTEGITDETGTAILTGIGGIGARLAAETGGPRILVAVAIEIGLAFGLLPLESLVGTAVGKMVPNQPRLPLVLSFQILFLLSFLEGIVAH